LHRKSKVSGGGEEKALGAPQDPTESFVFSFEEEDEKPPTPSSSGKPVETRSLELGDSPEFVPPESMPRAEGPRIVLRGELAEGGRGKVWRAVHAPLGRVVAVKKVHERLYEKFKKDPFKLHMAEGQFYQEALVAGLLEHPNILPIYDYRFDDDGYPQLVMKLVKGRPWDEVIAEDMARMSELEFLLRHLPIFIDMMQAVAFAHSMKVVHRDLKPSQVMVGEFGEVLLMDWGLALYTGNEPPTDDEEARKALSHLPTPATARFGCGTPALMAPEQTRNDASAISPATDVFLLGGTLYYLLTGKYPHPAKESHEAIALARESKIKRPEVRAKRRWIPRELADLAMEALSPDPQDRIPSVTEFIDRVEKYMSGSSQRRESAECVESAEQELELLREGSAVQAQRPDSYRPLSDCLHSLYRAEGLWPDNPRIGPVKDDVLWAYSRAAMHNNDLRLARTLTNQMKDTGRRETLGKEISEKESTLKKQAKTRRYAIAASFGLFLVLVILSQFYTTELRETNEELESQRDAAERARSVAEQARAEALREQYFTVLSSAGSFMQQGRTSKVLDLLYDKAPQNLRGWEWGALLAKAQRDAMTLFQVPSADMILDSTYSPDGRLIATGDRHGRLMLWDASTGDLLDETQLSKQHLWHLDFSPDGNLILAASFDRNAYLVDTETLETRRVLKGHEEYLRGSEFHPDGEEVVTTSRDGTARIWDVETGEQIGVFDTREGVAQYDFAFTNDGKTIAIVGRIYGRLFDYESREPLRDIPTHPENILDIAFSPGGTKLATACTDRNARIYDVETMEELKVIPNETSWLQSIDWSPDGSLIATGDNAGSIRLWDAKSGEMVHQYDAYPIVYKLEFSPDGQWLLSTSNASSNVWPVTRRDRRFQGVEQVAAEEIPGTEPGFTVDIFSAPLEMRQSWYNYDRRWRRGTGRHITRHNGQVIALDSHFTAISPDRKLRIQIDDGDLEANVYLNESNELIASLGAAYQVEFTRDGEHVVVLDPDGNFELWSTSNWKFVRNLGPSKALTEDKTSRLLGHFSISPDGSKILRGTHEGEVLLVDLETGGVIREFKPEDGYVFQTAFSPDGSLCAAGGFASTVRVWEVESGRLVSKLIGDENYILGLSFSPDNSRILTASHSDNVKLWEVETGREIMNVFSYPGETFLLGASFSPDGEKVIAAMSYLQVEILEAYPRDLPTIPQFSDMPPEYQGEYLKRRRHFGERVIPEHVDMYQPLEGEDPGEGI